MWPSEPEVLISPTRQYDIYHYNSDGKPEVLDYGELARRKCQQVSITSNDTGNSDMATKNGSSYTTGTTTDSVEIPTASSGFSMMSTSKEG